MFKWAELTKMKVRQLACEGIADALWLGLEQCQSDGGDVTRLSVVVGWFMMVLQHLGGSLVEEAVALVVVGLRHDGGLGVRHKRYDR